MECLSTTKFSDFSHSYDKPAINKDTSSLFYVKLDFPPPFLFKLA
jgi:hypothetical protein